MPSALEHVMQRATLKARRRLARDFGEIAQLQSSPKGTEAFAHAACVRAERDIVEALMEARPGFGVRPRIGEETQGEDATQRWLVDPMQGMENFCHALPYFALTIALEHEGAIIAGLVCNPATDETFTAERGRGAFSNTGRLRVSAEARVENALVAVNTGATRPLPQTTSMRRLEAPSLDMAYVAAGRLDAALLRPGPLWVHAAGGLLIHEAGGVFDAEKAIASNAALMPDLTQAAEKD